MHPVNPVQGTSIFPPIFLIAIYVSSGILFLTLIFLLIHFLNRKLSFAHKLREFIIWTFFLILLAAIFGGYFFLSTPKVASIFPENNSLDVDPGTHVTITFNRPVARRVMEKVIYPDTPGTWVFEEPLYTTHFNRKVTFYADFDLKPDTEYSIKIGNIRNSLQTTKPYDLEFTFRTKGNPVIAKELQKVESQTVKLGVPAYLQQHNLSCEVAALRMALAYRGISKSEDELLSQVGVDNTPHRGEIWGNPYEQFVGNVNGKQMVDGYGVFWGPIERVAKLYGNAQAFQNGNISSLTQSIKDGNPVIIWVYSKRGNPTRWRTPSGVEISTISDEHTVVAIGYVGPSDNPTQIIVNDPLTGQQYWSRSQFDRKWASFSQSGVIIFK